MKRALSAGPVARVESNTKVRVPEPKPFGGARNVKELDNFVWDSEEYFKTPRVLDGQLEFWSRTH